MPTINHNPDVLTCLANLSSDEVFTPPKLAEAMLDLLPADVWQNPDVTFLDPVCKTGVYLREITRRLNDGLEKQMPNRQKRINHILTKQVFGLGITELTALVSRRSLYCSKIANGKYSICNSFDNQQGNIHFERIEHHWENGKCSFCGANEKNYQRSADLETHAYSFIHTDNPQELFNMKFDVIVGNPPYQLNDGGGTGSSAIPIYQHFVEQAKKLNPRYLTMVIPSRWFTGGRGLDEFREKMLHDKKIRTIHDFMNSGDCFPGVKIEGGVCYFLWECGNEGDCEVHTHKGDKVISKSSRPLLEENAETFIRYNEAVEILHKVQSHNERSFADLVSANDPFGFDVREKNSYRRIKPTYSTKKVKGSITFYYNGWKKDGIGYINPSLIKRNFSWVNKYKVYISKAYGMGETFPCQVLNKPFVGLPGSCCTETYLLIGPLDNKKLAHNISSYMETRLFRFLVLMIKNTQNGMKKVYTFVPTQDFSESWTDDKLYKKYGLTDKEIAFVESMVRPMEDTNA